MGKLADILVLGADPLSDISNLWQLETVITESQIIDPRGLPTNPVTREWEAQTVSSPSRGTP